MRNMLIVSAALVALGLSELYAAEPSKRANNPDISGFSRAATNIQSADVVSLRDGPCGGNPSVDPDANNAAFAACVMLGAVDMIREWQELDPAPAPRVCVRRTISAGGLILVVQEYIETTTPWRQQQTDAATSVIGALPAKWPCR